MTKRTQQVRVSILTISDGVTHGARQDASGDAVQELAAQAGWQVVERSVVPDERPAIAAALTRFADELDVEVVLTTGGTGLTRRDVTPEATREIIDYEVPGLAEAMRMEGYKHTPFALLSRALAGVRARTLIVNLPGSPKGVRESLEVAIPIIPHAVELLRAERVEHG